MSDPKGMKMMVFLEPDPIDIHLLSVRCPFIFILLYTAIKCNSKATVNKNNIYSRL